MKSISTASLETKQQNLEFLQGKVQFEIPYTPNEALALFVDLKFTRQKYKLLHAKAQSRNSDLYPPYYKIEEAEKSCYPAGEIQISDVSVKIPLQSLLNHTAQRLIQTCDASLFENINRKGLKMISKWGMDGASGQGAYKQIFKDDCGDCSDNSVFMISIVPLRIQSADETLWTNPHPSSTRFCRPISFEYIKEKEDSTVEEHRKIEEEVENLKATVITVAGKRILVHHKLYVTMIDGKTTSYLTST